MEFFKAFFLVLLFAAAPFGLSWLFEQQTSMFEGLGMSIAYDMFIAIVASTAYAVAFVWMTILVMIGLEEGS